MAKYRDCLPQLAGDTFLADGGLETALMFHNGFDLPHEAAFVVLRDEDGKVVLRRWFEKYIAIAKKHRMGLLLETATWRANPDWASKIGYSEDELCEVNRDATNMLIDLRRVHETDESKIVISGSIGPRGDGYRPSELMNPKDAEDYHGKQVLIFKECGADLVSAITMTNVNEAIGITRAAQKADMPVVVSFTVETDGRLPEGHSVKDAIALVDRATGDGPAYYMINCAHPTHFATALAENEPWVRRIMGVRANASKKSHAELDECGVLDEGDPHQLGQEYKALKRKLPHLTVLGGCCGTDERHIDAIGLACAA